MKKCVIFTHFTMKIIRTCTWTVIWKFYLLKNILAYCGYSLTSPFFFLLSEHKHCDNTATNSNRENARSRMVTSLLGRMGTGTKDDESSTGRVWAAGFHLFFFLFFLFLPGLTWCTFWNLWTIHFFYFSNFFQAAFNYR